MQDYSVARTSARRLNSGTEDPFWDPRCQGANPTPQRDSVNSQTHAACAMIGECAAELVK